MRVADVVAGTLVNYGARQAFGMPGGEVVTLIDALSQAGVEFLLTRQESGAAIMAAGYATATGRPGVLVTTLGPGLANAVNGIADASQEHVPLIVLTGVVDRAVRGRYTHQIIDQSGMLRPFVKGCFEVNAAGAAAITARAIELALAHPMGPVLIELSPGTALEAAADPHGTWMPPKRVRANFAQPEDLSDISAILNRSKRPLILAGFDAARTGAADAVRQLAETYSIPVITTYKAKGVLPEHHSLALGAAGLSPLADGILLPVCRAADVVLLVGYDPIEMRTGWIDPFASEARIIEISPGPYDHAMHSASLRIEGDIASLSSGLSERAAPVSPVWPCGRPGKAKSDLQVAFATPQTWGPHAVIDVLEAALPGDAIVTVDSGAHRILLSQKMRVGRPLALLQSAGFCTMGAAVPLAAGVKLALRTTPVVAVVGDGGLEMGLGELSTLRDGGLPIVIMVFQDQSLALIEWLCLALLLRHCPLRRLSRGGRDEGRG
ncbi:MAG: thiamine pyrophosphate-binding protein, partial [Hyphomicrobium sp.]|nr:thiamine pyrophosphate-binding protein [Hyphomicrobium sp.]